MIGPTEVQKQTFDLDIFACKIKSGKFYANIKKKQSYL